MTPVALVAETAYNRASMNHYVYRIDRPATGEWYVGIRSCKCWPTEDTNYLGSGVVIKSKIAIHGQDQFAKTVLAQVESRAEAERVEAGLVDHKQLKDPLCMNMYRGGSQGSLGYVHTDETKSKMSESSRGKKHTDETKAKMSATRKGKNLSSDHCSAISAAGKGKKKSPEARRSMSAAWTPERREAARIARTGSKYTEESRRKMRESQRNRSPVTDESRRKMSESAKRAWAKRKEQM